MNVIPFHCGPFANESERAAFEHVRSRIESSLGPSDDQWILLTNLTWSVTHRFQADEIDMIAIGPPGVRDLGLLIGVNDAERMKRLTPRFEAAGGR